MQTTLTKRANFERVYPEMLSKGASVREIARAANISVSLSYKLLAKKLQEDRELSLGSQNSAELQRIRAEHGLYHTYYALSRLRESNEAIQKLFNELKEQEFESTEEQLKAWNAYYALEAKHAMLARTITGIKHIENKAVAREFFASSSLEDSITLADYAKETITDNELVEENENQ